MSIVAAKGDRGHADILFSRIVRSRGQCAHCGTTDYPQLQTAHIIRRSYSATRCDEANAFCLCATAHRRFTDHPDEWMEFVDQTIGRAAYAALKAKAEAGIQGSSKVFWREEVARLKARCVELGLDPRRKVPA